MNIRAKHTKEEPYTCVDNTSLNDKKLSFKALGILTYLLSKPDSWNANIEELTSSHNDGRDSVKSGVNELVEGGYIVRNRVIDNETKRVISWNWTVYEKPQTGFPQMEKPQMEKPQMEKPQMENPFVDSENEDSHDEFTGKKPQTGFPQVGFPQVENPTLVSTEYSNNTLSTNVDEQARTNSDLGEGKKEKRISKKSAAATTPADSDDDATTTQTPDQQEWFAALCWLVFGHKEYKLLSKIDKIAIGKTAKEIRGLEYTIDDLRNWYANRWCKEFPGLQRDGRIQRPMLKQIKTGIGTVKPTAHTNGFNAPVITASIPTYKRMAQL